jgi:hypothetical protein
MAVNYNKDLNPRLFGRELSGAARSSSAPADATSTSKSKLAPQPQPIKAKPKDVPEYRIIEVTIVVPSDGLKKDRPFEIKGKVQQLVGALTKKKVRIECITRYKGTEDRIGNVEVFIENNAFAGECKQLFYHDGYQRDKEKPADAKFTLEAKAMGSGAEKEATSKPVELPLDDDNEMLKKALHQLSAQALDFANSFIKDAGVRQNYIDKIKKMSDEILADINAGQATAREGAEFANQVRNQIMEECRVQSSAIGKAMAEAEKKRGKSIEELIRKYSRDTFGKEFEELTHIQKQSVYKKIVEASGRSSPKFSAKIPRWQLLGKGCLLVTVAITTYNIWTAENKIQAGLKEGIVLGGGFLGGAIAGSATGLVCGPGAPACSTVLFIIGGIIGTLAGEGVATLAEDQILEFSEWIGSYAE